MTWTDRAVLAGGLALLIGVCAFAGHVAPRPCTAWTIATASDTTWYEVQCVRGAKLVADADSVKP